jgi:DNA polymerase-3 subunit delta'
MPDLASLLRESGGAFDIAASAEWVNLSSSVSKGIVPHALAVCMPHVLVSRFLDLYAKRVLCRSGTGEDGCVSCRAWRENEHPDMLVLGRVGEPVGIDDCMAFQSMLYLKPVIAHVKLGVIHSAENMSLPAANSLLKLTEEPPESGRLLFTVERDSLMPTIRSRVWMINFTEPAALREPEPPPDSSGWAEWLEKTRRMSVDELAASVDSWVMSLCERGKWKTAASVQNIMYLAKLRHMPVSMVQDALYALLWEGMHFEHIFGDLRET